MAAPKPRDAYSIDMEDVHHHDSGGLDPPKDDNIAELPLAESERQILSLHDRLEEIQLEISLLKALETLGDDISTDVTEEQIQTAQEELLQAKALYSLRENIVESVLIANPILKALHAGTNATPIERDLEPMIKARDEASIVLADVSSKILSTREKLTEVETEHVLTARKNAELAATMISLAGQANTQKGDITDPEMRQQLDELEDALKASRQRWRILKGTTSGVVAGSGVDWARDATLRELVLEDHEDD